MNQPSIFTPLRKAAATLAELESDKINCTLEAVAQAIENRSAELLEANADDCSRMDTSNPMYDRLKLTPERISDICSGIRTVASLPSPLGVVLDSSTRPNGLLIRRVSVPFGVIGSIFESRPNVAFDVFALCFKAGSACVLKGGHEAASTNAKAVEIIKDTLTSQGISSDSIMLLGNDHADTLQMLQARGEIDLVIPRGSRRLIDFVRDNARVPVIETGAGVCHAYLHESGDIATARDIIYNAKTRRVSVCNALDCLLVDHSRLDSLPAICYHLADKHVEIHADPEAFAALNGAYPYLVEATEEDYGKEWLDFKLTIRTVADIDEAIAYIAANGSGHSECILAENREASEKFLKHIDAACVYANVSTAFTDGGQFGFGAEIGISTQKLHARGPMALRELTTYKYLITGAGQTRP